MIQFCIGIDPGAKGGIALLQKKGDRVSLLSLSRFDKDSYKEIMSLGKKLCEEQGGELFCVLEKVHAMPTQGVTSMFHFGENYGFLKGLLDAYEIPIREVSPPVWKKAMMVTSEKETSIQKAKEYFPGIDLRGSKRCKKDSDGIAEAILLAVFGMDISYPVSYPVSYPG